MRGKGYKWSRKIMYRERGVGLTNLRAACTEIEINIKLTENKGGTEKEGEKGKSKVI